MKTDIMKQLKPCPRSGVLGGVHYWLYYAANRLRELGVAESDQSNLITEAVANCGREVPQHEIEDTIKNSFLNATNGQKSPRWPGLDLVTLHNLALEKFSLADFEQLCPVKRNENQSCTEEVIDALFPGNPLICAGESAKTAETRMREKWRGEMACLQFIVPSPMSAITGVTKAGKEESKRSLSNTGPRRFVVIEFDSTPLDLQVTVLKHLSNYGRLVMVVHSGGKSLHGWFYCADWPEEKTEKFFKYAVSLGADRNLWPRCQPVRMPDGMRDTEVRQQVVYFDPKKIEKNVPVG